MQKNMSGSLGGIIDEMLSGSVAGNIQFDSSGTSDYEDLTNKPSINGVELIGDKTSTQLGINELPDSSQAGNGDVLTHTVSGDHWFPPRQYIAGDNITIEDYVISASSGASLTFKPAYILFRDGTKYNHIETYLPQLDCEYYLDFYIDNYQSNRCIFGSPAGSSRIHLTMFNDKWYTSNGSGEINFGDSTMITGRHTFVWNHVGDRKILFDNVEVGTCNGYVDGTLSIRLNDRTDGMGCPNSRIYQFKITNSNNEIIHDFRPYAIYQDDVLIDKCIIDVAGGMVLNVGYYEIIEIE